MNFASKWFLKSEHIADLCKINFWYQWEKLIQCNTDTCCDIRTGGVNITFVLAYWFVGVECGFMCDIKSEC